MGIRSSESEAVAQSCVWAQLRNGASSPFRGAHSAISAVGFAGTRARGLPVAVFWEGTSPPVAMATVS